MRNGESIVLDIQAEGAAGGLAVPYTAKLKEVAKMCAASDELSQLFQELVEYQKTVIDEE